MMTVQASKTVTDVDKVDLDKPIFDSQAFRLNDEQAAIIATARELGQTVFAGRAKTYDRDATFPPRITGICTAPACSASLFRSSMAASAPITRLTQ